ncbi:MAG: AAA family ATPase [Actinomycetota bacterium]
MLKRLYVDNYRCFVNFRLDLQELTLLVGPNGSGKSSILDLLHGLRQLLTGTVKVTDPTVFPTRSLTRWQDHATQVIEVVASVEMDDEVIYRLEIEHERENRRARIMAETLVAPSGPLFTFRKGVVQLYRDDHSQGPTYSADWAESALARVVPSPVNNRLTRFLAVMRGVSLCALDPKRFQAESLSEEPVLQLDGSNFASWYRHQIQERQDLMPGLINTLREVLDNFYTIRLERVGTEARAFMLGFRLDDQPYELRLDELSDGQRATIALYALVRLAGPDDFLFLDEPDNYLALAEIQPWLMTLADACGEGPRQAVLCSHHPELLDYLGAQSGVLLKRERSGSISTRRISEMPAEPHLKLSETFARGWEE